MKEIPISPQPDANASRREFGDDIDEFVPEWKGGPRTLPLEKDFAVRADAEEEDDDD